jgi:1-acyl-sn-glycerol-3-phosphate acyltransferase
VLSPDNVPARGGALLVSNHISFVDMLLILAGTRRFVRFRPPLDVGEHGAVKPFVRYFGVCRRSPESQLV